MQIESHFSNIRQRIVNEIELAKTTIQVAVAWFTNNLLFDKLCQKLTEGVSVELIIIDDEINNRIGGLDFQKFIKLGGTLYYGNAETPMHNKFCIIDNNVLINGSYNWTYFAESINYENIIIFKGVSDILISFKNEFESIKKHAFSVTVAKQYDINVTSYTSVFEIRNYLATDIYQFALEEEVKGNKQNSLSLINLSLNLKPNNEKYIQKRYEIRNVVYKKWNEDYIIDKIELNEDETILFFRTHIETGAWIHSPNAKYAWKLRNTQNVNQIFNCNAIKNIALNGLILLDQLKDISVFSFKQTSVEQTPDKTNIQKTEFNEQGLKLTNDGKTIDEKGRTVNLIEHDFKNKDELTCEIHFPFIIGDVNFVDLLEGIEAIDKANHWHCFDIELKRNKVDKTQSIA